jgi:hypothetical protein
VPMIPFGRRGAAMVRGPARGRTAPDVPRSIRGSDDRIVAEIPRNVWALLLLLLLLLLVMVVVLLLLLLLKLTLLLVVVLHVGERPRIAALDLLIAARVRGRGGRGMVDDGRVAHGGRHQWRRCTILLLLRRRHRGPHGGRGRRFGLGHDWRRHVPAAGAVAAE